MTDNLKNVVLAASLSLPISLFGAYFGFGLAHSDRIMFIVANILFAPFIVFSYVTNDILVLNLPEMLFNSFALISQFVGYLLVITIVRRLVTKKQAEKN
jgi:hypothetical protein